MLLAYMIVRRARIAAMPCTSRWIGRFYGQRLACLEERWVGTGRTGTHYLEPDHPAATDLDLFGVGSVFERLGTPCTRAGENTLAGWLVTPGSAAEVRSRQAAIVELRERLDLREDLELLGVEISAGIDPEALAEWGTSARAFPGKTVPVAATVLGVLGTAALVYWAYFGGELFWLLAVLCADGVLARLAGERVRGVLAAVDKRTHDLVLVAELLRRLDREPFESPTLRRLVESL